jgi:hypothetical protein
MDGHTDERRVLLEYVEQFAAILTASGMQRMSARVFTYILVDDADTYTAAEIAEGLSISLAAVSGAVRELIAAGLLAKGRRASTRSRPRPARPDRRFHGLHEGRDGPDPRPLERPPHRAVRRLRGAPPKRPPR